MSARPIRSSELLRLAAVLAGRGAGRGRPRTVELRRAISTAYYAVFHELTTRAADQLLEGTTSGPSQTAVTRWFAHLDVRDLAGAATGKAGSAGRRAVAAVLSPSPDLRATADTFVLLQDQRHGADYDHLFDVTRRSALQAVDQADSALGLMDSMSKGNDDSFTLFLRLRVGAVKIAKNR